MNKIAKENLMALPLPDITQEQDKIIKELTLDAMERDNDEYLQRYINETVFGLTPEEISYINDSVSEKKERASRHARGAKKKNKDLSGK